MIRRRKPLARSTKPIKRSPIARSSKPIPKRRARPRRGPLRCKPYRDWIAAEAKCPACAVELARLEPGVDRYRFRAALHPGYCDPAHTQNNGMRSKGPDSSCGALCRGFNTPNHHDEYDAGRVRFEAKYGLDMKADAAARWCLWRLLNPDWTE